jgi:cytochrome P450
MTNTTDHKVSSSIDPWTTEFFADPNPDYSQLREAAPVVYLEKYGIWCTARYNVIKDMLDDWGCFSNAGGAGLANFLKEKPWRTPSIILEADPPVHTRSRKVLSKILSPKVMRELRQSLDIKADALVGELLSKGNIDAMKELVIPYALDVFPSAVGLKTRELENFLHYGAMVSAGFGPENEHYHSAMKHADTVLPWVDKICERTQLDSSGLGEMIYLYVDSGELTNDEAAMLVRSFVSAGVDTTVSAIGNLLYCMATNPEEFHRLKNNPELVRNCYSEMLRFDGPVIFIFRTTTKSTVIHGCEIPAKEKVLLLTGAGNLDPDLWQAPNQFDISRNNHAQLGFGAGIHSCVGQPLARLEGESVLKAMLHHVDEIELSAEPERLPPTGMRSFTSLPVKLR